MGSHNKNESTEATQKETKQRKFKGEKVPCLVMVEGNYIGETYPLSKSVVIIGRGNKADLVVSDSSVSRTHAKIERMGDKYVICDLGSTNGTLLNGEKVAEKEKDLKDGDKIELGRIVMKFGFQDSLDKDYHEKLRNMAIRDGHIP